MHCRDREGERNQERKNERDQRTREEYEGEREAVESKRY